ncbi:MAG: tRNA guanosine(15) transglycosylase TgtA [Candidatus Thorarchaeota archaeon]
MSNFEIRAKDGLGRIGKFKTKHGTVTTPLLMPVVHPGKSEIRPRELIEEFQFQMVITNSYIINRQKRFRSIAESEGIHTLLDFDGPIMTDSGTFQMYFHDLPEGEINPLDIVRFQRTIGSDIGTILDVFSSPDAGRAQVEKDVEISLERAKISVAEKGEMYLAGTVQGGIYPDLREHSSKILANLDFDVHPIGGVVPMMEQYRYADVVRATLAAKGYLPPDRPVHLFGCGHPMFLALAAALGSDFFDSASYAKFAEDDRMMLTTGTVHLHQLRELPCDCPVCSSTTADDLKQMKAAERHRALMKHNLYVTAAEMRRVRQAIIDGKLLDLVAERARAHPSLYEAFHTLLDNIGLLEQAHPVGGNASIFYTGPETVRTVPFYRFHMRMVKSYPYKKTRSLVLIPHIADRPFAETTPTIVDAIRKISSERALLAFVTPFGIVPWELEHIHPVQQTIFPQRIDGDTMAIVEQRVEEFIHELEVRDVFWFNRTTPTNRLSEVVKRAIPVHIVDSASAIIEEGITGGDLAEHWTRRKLRAVMAYQWNVNHSLLPEDIRIEVSKGTGKIRYVKQGEEVLFTMVPTTGLLAPTVAGGVLLEKMEIPTRYRVKMHSDAVEFIRAGKSALAKFVIEADPELRSGEEVLVQDPDGDLIAVGRAVLNGPEMLRFQRGVAVNIRHSKKL